MKLKWSTKPPEFPAKACLVTKQYIDGTRCVEEGWAGFGEISKGAIAWAAYPNFQDSKEGWKSEYMGDELPEKDGRYIATKEKRIPRICRYNSQKSLFGGDSAVIAWMDIPKPYSGNKS